MPNNPRISLGIFSSFLYTLQGVEQVKLLGVLKRSAMLDSNNIAFESFNYDPTNFTNLYHQMGLENSSDALVLLNLIQSQFNNKMTGNLAEATTFDSSTSLLKDVDMNTTDCLNNQISPVLNSFYPEGSIFGWFSNLFKKIRAMFVFQWNSIPEIAMSPIDVTIPDIYAQYVTISDYKAFYMALYLHLRTLEICDYTFSSLSSGNANAVLNIMDRIYDCGIDIIKRNLNFSAILTIGTTFGLTVSFATDKQDFRNAFLVILASQAVGGFIDSAKLFYNSTLAIDNEDLKKQLNEAKNTSEFKTRQLGDLYQENNKLKSSNANFQKQLDKQANNSRDNYARLAEENRQLKQDAANNQASMNQAMAMLMARLEKLEKK